MSMDDTEDSPIDETPHFAFHANFKALRWDYAKAIGVLVVVLGAWAVSDAGSVSWYIFAILTVAFCGLLANTFWRHGVRIEMDEQGVTSGWRNPFQPDGGIIAKAKRLEWENLSGVRLRFFSRKAQSEQTGWMMVQLRATAPDGKATVLTFDGDHECFQPVLRFAWSLASQRGLPLDEATLANLEATGIETSEGNPWTS